MMKAKIPVIRFKGFNDEWNQKLLKDISEKVTEKNVNFMFSETFTNSALFGVVSQQSYFEHNISNIENIGGYYIVRENDFVYNPRISTNAPCGPINRNTLNRIGIVSPLYTVFRIHDVNCVFLEWYFKTSFWYLFMRLNGDSGARADRFSISNEKFFQMPVLLPFNKSEQQRIGSFFEHLDSIISGQQTKLEKLKNIKASLLNKMFPVKGEKIPAIRFKGFSEEWEENLLGNFFEERTERSGIGELISVTLNSGVILASENGRYDNSSEIKSNYKVVEVGDIAYNSMRMWQGASGYCRYKGIVSPAYTVVKPLDATDSVFFSFELKLPRMINSFKQNSQGLTKDTWNLKYPAFSRIVGSRPSIPEQQRIGSFFEKLDKLISLQEQKITKLQNIKKAFLAKMFA